MRAVTAYIALLTFGSTALAQKQFGFDNRVNSGQPYRTPEETVAGLTVPPEFSVHLFAGEPEVVNPVAFTIDERGRVWVLECFEYPSKTPKGKSPRDRIVILEDTDNDGRCDRRTVFATGADFPIPEERAKAGLPAFDIATGLEVGRGKVFLGAPPYLWTIDIVGDNHDKPGRFEPVLSGFGSQDTHETLNTFTWGPDGHLYGLQGIFTQSTVQGADGEATRMNAAVWRYQPATKKFEIFAEGTSNPWGMDWRTTDGEWILACCVIPHLYHVVPGGVYRRQAGQGENPHAYDYIQEISDHTFHKESGWAHAGLISLDVPHMPKRFRQSVIFGSIHGNSLKQNVLAPRASSYVATRGDDFLTSQDKNFRPINLKWGPHGDVYLIDWHDQNPCHQAAPDSWDQSRGRVYRIQLKDRPAGPLPDLAGMTREQLARAIASPVAHDPWQHRAMRRLFAESKETGVEYQIGNVAEDKRLAFVQTWLSTWPKIDEAVRKAITAEVAKFGRGEPAVRVAAVRAMGDYAGTDPDSVVRWLAAEAAVEPHPFVRREVAAAANRLAGRADVTPVVHALLSQDVPADDPLIPHHLWLATEQMLAKSLKSSDAAVKAELDWLAAHAGREVVRERILPKALRRVAATGQERHLELAIAAARDIVKADPAAGRAALAGLATALEGRSVPPPPAWPGLKAVAGQEVRADIERLAVAFRDPELAARSLATARDAARPEGARKTAIERLGRLKPPGASDALVAVARSPGPVAVRVGAVRSLGAFADLTGADVLLENFAAEPPAYQAEVVALFSSQKPLARRLLAAVAAGSVPRAAVSQNVVVKMQSFQDAELDRLVESAWGRVRATPEEINVSIARHRKLLQTTPGDFARGREVFAAHCAKCHQFDGTGQAVGPGLDGAGRDVEYLLANVLDPNRVVGAPYFLRTATLLDGRVEQGLLHAEDAESVTLKGENAVLKRIAKADLDGPVQTAEKSTMPEGLAEAIGPSDFVHLVRYLVADPPLTHGTLGGQPLAAPVTGEIPLPRGTSVLEFPLRVSRDGSARLDLAGYKAVTATLDGAPIDPRAGPVRLAAGDHRLRLTVESYGTPFTARWHDPERRIIPVLK